MKLEAAGRPTETPRKGRLNLKGKLGVLKNAVGAKLSLCVVSVGAAPLALQLNPLDYLLVLAPVSSKKASPLPVAAL